MDLGSGPGFDGGNGGNNRNSTRGGGLPGGAGSVESVENWDYNAAASDGAPGYVKIYRIN